MSTKNPLPSLDRLNSLLQYDQETGLLKWRERPLSEFSDERICNAWNSRFAGKEAGNKRADSGKKVSLRIDGVAYLAHRIAWAMAGKEVPPGDMHIDHINGNGHDNRLENLRTATNQQNSFNRSKSSKKPRSISGVHWASRDEAWTACLRINYKTLHLGTFRSKGEAAVASAKASLRHFGKFSPYYRQFA